MSTLSTREKLLASIVAGVAFVFINAFVIDYFLKKQTQLKGELARNNGALLATKRMLSERVMWQEREAWLGAHQPRSGGEEGAGVQLMEATKEVAGRHAVEIEKNTLSLRSAVHKPAYTSVSVSFGSKSNWKGLLGFVGELQGPEKFVVLESVTLKVDAADPTQMHGDFRVAKWFAPVRKSP
jgi:hypothetical protein